MVTWSPAGPGARRRSPTFCFPLISCPHGRAEASSRNPGGPRPGPRHSPLGSPTALHALTPGLRARRLLSLFARLISSPLPRAVFRPRARVWKVLVHFLEVVSRTSCSPKPRVIPRHHQPSSPLFADPAKDSPFRGGNWGCH